MSMRYFQDFSGQVHGFDQSLPGDLALMGQVATGWTEVTGNWPPPPTEEQLAAAKLQQTQTAIEQLSSQGSDASMSRGLEDLVGLLIAKGTIAKTDLPAPLLAKIDNRRAVRGQAAL